MPTKRMSAKQRTILEVLINRRRRTTIEQLTKRLPYGPYDLFKTLTEFPQFFQSVKGKDGQDSSWRVINQRKIPKIPKPIWKKMNERRTDLITKRSNQGLNRQEILELEDLQEVGYRYINRGVSLLPKMRELEELRAG